MNEITPEFIEKLDQAVRDRYELIKPIQYQQLSVFLASPAVHTPSNRRVMMHLFIAQLKDDQRENIYQSLRQLTRIDHHQLPEVFDVGELSLDSKIYFYLVMRHPGKIKSMDEWLNDPTLTTNAIVTFIRSLISLIIFLSEQNIHGLDLKFDHLAMHEDGEPRLLTLGIPAFCPESHFTAMSPAYSFQSLPEVAANRKSQISTIDPALLAKADVYSLGITLQEILDKVNQITISDHDYLKRIVQNLVNQCQQQSDNGSQLLTDLLHKLNTGQDFTRTIPELSQYPAKTLRLPEMISLSLTKRLIRLINHPWFQRLTRIKQLGLGYLVYPGATHTRFEHSLGVYYNMTDYINALFANPDNASFRLMMNEQDILTGMLAGLLHDIGHYPFAHTMENVDHHRFNHVHRTYWFLDKDLADELKSILPCDHSIYDLIQNDWQVHPEDIVRILGKPGITPMAAQKVRIFQSMISSPIDADKLDYLVRDSIHAGVQYGRSLDRDRFLQALTINNSWDSIALSEKGRISAELIMICRYAMYSEVYWHHAIRALHAMITAAVRYYVEQQPEDAFKGGITSLDRLFLSSSDDQIIDLLAKSGGKTARLIDSLQRRVIYKRALVVRSYDEDKDLFDHLIQVEKQGPKNVEHFRSEFRRHLATFSELSGLQDEDLLLDIPPSQSIKSVPLILKPSGREIHLGDQSSVWENIKMNFEKWVRKIRFYIHPEFYEHFTRMDRSALARDIKDCAAQFFYRD